MPPVRQLAKPVEPSPVKDDFAHWTPSAFKCKCPGCGGRDYPARLYGPWAVFEHDELGWELIHVKTRLAAVSGMSSEEDCFRVGDFLQRRFPLVLRLGTAAEMKAKMDGMHLYGQIRDWNAAMKKTGKFVAPTF